MKIPVYIFTGFFEGGKTSIINESMCDERFNTGEKTLVLSCEEGFTPYDFGELGRNVTFETLENEYDLTREHLSALLSSRTLDRVIIEYNGMWLLEKLYAALPEDCVIYQNMMFCDASKFLSYNKNMRQLTVDKARDAEMIVLNRTPDDIDKDEIHKVIRGISRRAAIVYDYPDGHVEYDEIEDPLPFDKNASIVVIADEDYALFYRDLAEDTASYNGKTVKFKGMAATSPVLDKNSVVVGRHIMTCCENDIQYDGIACVFKNPHGLKTNDWVTVTGKIRIEKNKIYSRQGPVLYVEKSDFAVKPENPVATFY